MRSSLETSSFRIAVLASGLAILSAACSGSSGTPNGAGGSSADAGSDAKAGTGGSGAGGKADAGGDVKADSGTGGMGMGGKTDSGTDSGTGGMGTGGTVVIDAAVDTGPMLNPPWHAYLPLVTAATGAGTAMGTSLDLSPNHYDSTWFGSTLSFMNGSVNLTGVATENVVVPAKAGVPAVDVTGSYSVQAWVTMTNVGGFQTVVSGEGFNIASFFLQKRVDLGGAWFFTTQAGDAISSANCIAPPLAAVDGGPAQNPVVVLANVQYHLVATRDATTNTQILYVNGAESGRATCPAGFVDTGILGIGHSVFNGGRVDQVQGAISDVGVINRVLTPAEVTALFNKGRTYVAPPPPDAGPDLPADTGTDVPAAPDGGTEAGGGG